MTATSASSGTADPPRPEAPVPSPVPPGPDPRPRVVRDTDGPAGAAVVRGTRCTACAHPSLEPVDRCPACHGPSRYTTFAGRGSVFSSTVLRIPVGEIDPPTTLVYVDLDDGPRVLGHAPGDRVVPPGTRVRLTGLTAHGDPSFVRDRDGADG